MKTPTRIAAAIGFAVLAAAAMPGVASAATPTFSTAGPLATGATINKVTLGVPDHGYNASYYQAFSGGSVTTSSNGGFNGYFSGPYDYTPDGTVNSNAYAFTIPGSITVAFNTAQSYFGALINNEVNNGQTSAETLTFYNGATNVYSLDITNLLTLAHTGSSSKVYSAFANFDMNGAGTFNKVVMTSTNSQERMTALQFSSVDQTFTGSNGLSDTTTADVDEPGNTFAMLLAAMAACVGMTVQRKRMGTY